MRSSPQGLGLPKPAGSVAHLRFLSTSIRPRPKASIRPHRPGMSSSSRWPMALGQRRVDDEVLADRLEAEHRAQEQQRRPGRPGLRAARRRVLHRVLRERPRVAGERLRQAAVEELGRVENAGRDPRGLLAEPVAPQAPRDERVVERPHGADVVADGVVAALGPRPACVRPSRRRARGPSGAARRPWPSTCRRCRSRAGGRCSRRARRPVSRPGRARARSTRRPRPRSPG